MDTLIVGLIMGGLGIGLLIRWVLAAQKPPTFHVSPSATVNGGPGGAAVGERPGRFPFALLAGLAIVALIVFLAVSTINGVIQHFTPERIPVVVTVAPQAEPATAPQVAPPVATVEIPREVPAVKPAQVPTVAPVVKPIEVPAPDTAPAWFVPVLAALGMVAGSVWGWLGFYSFRNWRNSRKAAGVKNPREFIDHHLIGMQYDYDQSKGPIEYHFNDAGRVEYTTPPAPAVLDVPDHYNARCAVVPPEPEPDSDTWLSSIPDEIFEGW